MSNKESRRTVPASAIAIVVFAVLVVFEVLVIGGFLGIKASNVARIAPWAYEPFLRLVGEHPESETLKESVREEMADRTNELSGIESVAGFNPDGVTLDLDPLEAVGGEAISNQEPSGAAVPEIEPTEPPVTNQTPDRPKKVVPVG